MSEYEYRVVPAPARGVKAKGVRSAEARFSLALEQLMNEMGGEGWEYQRAETLPSIERSGLTSSTTEWRNVLVFRRAKPKAEAPMRTVKLLAEKEKPTPRVAPPAESPPAKVPDALDAPFTPRTAKDRAEPPVSTPQTPDEDASGSAGASRMLRDNGVEELSDVSGQTDSLKRLAALRNPDKTVD